MPEELFHHALAEAIKKLREFHDADIARLENTLRREKEEHERLKQRAKYLIQGLDTVKEPVINTKRDETIRFVNQRFVDTFGYSEGDIVGKPFHEYISGLEFLVQAQDHPEIMDIETEETLRSLPVTVITKEGTASKGLAKIQFNIGEAPGYHGAGIIVEKRGRISMPRFPIGSAYGIFPVLDTYAEGRSIVVQEIDPPEEKRVVKKKGSLIKHKLLDDILSALQGKTKKRGFIVQLTGVETCHPKVFPAFLELGKLAKKTAKHGLLYFVDAHSPLHKEFIDAGLEAYTRTN